MRHLIGLVGMCLILILAACGGNSSMVAQRVPTSTALISRQAATSTATVPGPVLTATAAVACARHATAVAGGHTVGQWATDAKRACGDGAVAVERVATREASRPQATAPTPFPRSAFPTPAPVNNQPTPTWPGVVPLPCGLGCSPAPPAGCPSNAVVVVVEPSGNAAYYPPSAGRTLDGAYCYDSMDDVPANMPNGADPWGRCNSDPAGCVSATGGPCGRYEAGCIPYDEAASPWICGRGGDCAADPNDQGDAPCYPGFGSYSGCEDGEDTGEDPFNQGGREPYEPVDPGSCNPAFGSYSGCDDE